MAKPNVFRLRLLSSVIRASAGSIKRLRIRRSKAEIAFFQSCVVGSCSFARLSARHCDARNLGAISKSLPLPMRTPRWTRCWAYTMWDTISLNAHALRQPLFAPPSLLQALGSAHDSQSQYNAWQLHGTNRQLHR